MFDVTIIGAGVIGCSIARELSKYKLQICVLEKAEDVCNGTSKANSAIIHAGFDAKPSSMKGKLNAKGNAMFDKLAAELDFPFKKVGSLVICFNRSDIPALEKLKLQGEKNGVPNLKILDKEALRAMEPNLSETAQAALYAPTGAITCPYEFTVALAENAYDNGVTFNFDSEVINIEKLDKEFIITTNKEKISSGIVINAAGVHSDEINNLVSKRKICITPRKGEYCLFDKMSGNLVNMTIFQLPTKLGKGVLVTPTVDGNLLVGPNAVEIEDKEDLTTSQEGIEEVLEKAKLSVKELPIAQIITSFSGLRARSEEEDFIIGEAQDVENFVNVAAIESPGLSSAPAIALMVEEIIVNKLKPERNPQYNPIRKGISKFREMSNEERKAAIKQSPAYGKIICRCETVSEAEILAAIRRPLGAKTIDGIKRRTRAGMGRCQSGFCSARIVDILARELKLDPMDVTKFGGNSNLLTEKNKESIK